jgi:hypothetical protein
VRKRTGITYEKTISIHILARDIANNLESALEQFRGICEDSKEK